MLHRLYTAVCSGLAFAVMCSACCKKNEDSDPPQAAPENTATTVTTAKVAPPKAVATARPQPAQQPRPAPQPQPQPPPQAPPPQPQAQKFRPLSGDEISAMTKKIASGHKIHPEHSFGLVLKGFEGSVLATTGPKTSTFVFHFFDTTGKRVTSVFDKNKDAWLGDKILAVAFEDVDRDGYEDSVVLAKYLSARNEYNGVSVYTRSGGGPFRYHEGLSERGGTPSSMAGALSRLR